MRIAPFLEDFAVRRQGVPFRSAQFVRVPAYIRGALRTTRPTSFGSGYADPGTDAPYPEVHGETLTARGHLTPVPPFHPMERGPETNGRPPHGRRAWIAQAWLSTLIGAFVLLPGSLLACSACYGQSDSALAKGMNWGIASLLGVVVAVLGGLSSFFFVMARRAAHYRLPENPSPNTDPNHPTVSHEP